MPFKSQYNEKWEHSGTYTKIREYANDMENINIDLSSIYYKLYESISLSEKNLGSFIFSLTGILRNNVRIDLKAFITQ